MQEKVEVRVNLSITGRMVTPKPGGGVATLVPDSPLPLLIYHKDDVLPTYLNRPTLGSKIVVFVDTVRHVDESGKSPDNGRHFQQ
jgi:hypothetical protein